MLRRTIRIVGNFILKFCAIKA